MRYHLEINRINEKYSLTACGRKINRIKGFVYNEDGFKGHYAHDLRCKQCNSYLQNKEFSDSYLGGKNE